MIIKEAKGDHTVHIMALIVSCKQRQLRPCHTWFTWRDHFLGKICFGSAFQTKHIQCATWFWCTTALSNRNQGLTKANSLKWHMVEMAQETSHTCRVIWMKIKPQTSGSSTKLLKCFLISIKHWHTVPCWVELVHLQSVLIVWQSSIWTPTRPTITEADQQSKLNQTINKPELKLIPI